MASVDPKDPKLRRIHRVYQEHLDKYRPIIKGGSIQPINILRQYLPEVGELIIVVDGTHRVQAALEMGVAVLSAREVSWAEAAAEAHREGHSLEHLVQHAIRFRSGEYGFSYY